MAQTYPHLHFIILCDDYGMRLWPVARRQAPACFAPTEPGSGESLLSSVASHVKPFSAAPLHIVTTDELADSIAGELVARAGLESGEFELLVPPERRGTAFSIALAAARIRHRDPDAVIGVFPSNLHIGFDDRWEHLVYHAYQVALRDRIVLIGAQQESKCADFSYIRRAGQFENIEDAFLVRDLALNAREVTAQRAVREGALWCTGIFFARAAVALGALVSAAQHRRTPETQDANRIAETANFLAMLELRSWRKQDAKQLVEALPSVSYEKAALEGSEALAVIPTTIPFDSITTLSDLDAIAEPDAQGNREIGNALTIKSRGTTVYGEATTRQITTYGLDDVLVVDTPDALLVADKSQLSRGDALLPELERAGVAQLKDSVRRSFPWGEALLLGMGERYAVWRLDLRAGATFDTLTLPFEYGVLPDLRKRHKPQLHERYAVAEGDVTVRDRAEGATPALVGAGDGFTAQTSRALVVSCVEEAPATLVMTAVVDAK